MHTFTTKNVPIGVLLGELSYELEKEYSTLFLIIVNTIFFVFLNFFKEFFKVKLNAVKIFQILKSRKIVRKSDTKMFNFFVAHIQDVL